MLDILFLGARALKQRVDELQRRVDALEASALTHMVERNTLITHLSASEARLRAMLTRAEKVTAPKNDNGHSPLDAAVLNRKGW